MIRYALACDDGHQFQSWFQSADAFEKLSAAGLVSCAACGSGKVARSLMAPSVVADSAAPPREGIPREGVLSTPQTEAEARLAELRRKVETESDYVGLSFPAEARAMFAGEKPHRPVWGEARPEEARSLIEEGVPVMPLPFRPRSTTN